MTLPPARRQRGAALLALVAVIMVGGLWWLLSVVTPVNRAVLEREHNGRILREAKQAVLGWVIQNAADRAADGDWNPGKLPCPEALGSFTVPPGGNEGVIQGFCAGAAMAAGRLPWKSLGIDKPVDASGEVLWYVVGPGWKRANNTSPEPALGLNSNSLGTVTVDGQANAAVAAIIAPGRRLQTAPIASQIAQGCANRTQARATFPPASSADYLECLNVATASMRTAVADNATNETFNDQVILITAADVMQAIEPVIAKRIQNTVLPQLQQTHVTNAATWGADATNPVFPFAVAYPSSGAFDPSTSDFKGAVGSAHGLLPLSASVCNSLTTGRCDAAFIAAWDVTTVSATQTGGTASSFSANCSTSTTATATCVVSFSRVCLICFNDTTAVVRMIADAPNGARALRSLGTGASGLSGSTLTAPLLASGAARATYAGTLTASGLLCGTAIAVLCSSSATITIPITVFQDHPLATPTAPGAGSPPSPLPSAWYWFIANNWHHVTYYAVSPDDAPGGARNCTANNNCLNVTFDVGTSLTNRRAILALAGRSLNGTAGSSRAFSDFLDTTSNITFDSAFEQKRFGRGQSGTLNARGEFNDRFISLAP